LRRLAAALAILALPALPSPAHADRPLPGWSEYRAQRTLGIALDAWVRGRVHTAEEAASEVVRVDPSQVEGWRILALARLALGRHEAAAEASEPLALLATHDPEACLLRGRLAVETGDAGAAGAAYQRAAELLPGDPRPALGRALVAARIDGDFEAMGEHMRAARAIDPREPAAGLPLRAAWAPLAESEEFLEAFSKVLAETPAPE